MKISIAMASYNGGNYLEEQLDSFVNQTRQPDELVVCDDGSIDDTLEILKRFSQEAPFEVRIFRNEVKLGFIKNFEKALSLCRGDIIFLSDQDDVWFENKLKSIERTFSRHPEAMVVINDQVITDESLRNTGATILDNAKRLGLKESWFAQGCCTTLRKEWLSVALPIPTEVVGHDVWINRLAVFLSARIVKEESLQFYRRHENNASEAETHELNKVSRLKLLSVYGFKDARHGWEKEVQDIEQYKMRLNEREQVINGLIKGDYLARVLESLKENQQSLRRRGALVSLPRWRRWPFLFVFWSSGGYKQALGWKSMAKDLVRP